MRPNLLSLAAGILLTAMAPAAHAAERCDRACLSSLGDRLLDSMVRHAPGDVPLTPIYRATENGIAAGLPMMAMWRTPTGAPYRFYVIDAVTGQFFLIADIAEGSSHALLFGRLKAEGTKLAEIELYVDRARADGGFQFDATQLSHLPRAWTDRIAPGRLPDRATLLNAGKSIFDTRLTGPSAAPSCRLMENGKEVAEDPEVLKVVGGGHAQLPANADGTVPIPCGSPPIRPTDRAARTDIVDEEQGIVVSIGTVYGTVHPYLITDPKTSAFVPNSLGQPYLDLLAAQRKTKRYERAPELASTPASITVAQVQRYYDGKLQGMHLLEKLGPPGAVSPWMNAAAQGGERGLDKTSPHKP